MHFIWSSHLWEKSLRNSGLQHAWENVVLITELAFRRTGSSMFCISHPWLPPLMLCHLQSHAAKTTLTPQQMNMKMDYDYRKVATICHSLQPRVLRGFLPLHTDLCAKPIFALIGQVVKLIRLRKYESDALKEEGSNVFQSHSSELLKLHVCQVPGRHPRST